MREILEKLWRGDLTPQTRSFKRGTNYEDSLEMMCKNEEKLKSMLEGKESELFEKFCDARDEVDQYTEEDIFITGFRLGARIIVESFYENDGLFNEANA